MLCKLFIFKNTLLIIISTTHRIERLMETGIYEHMNKLEVFKQHLIGRVKERDRHLNTTSVQRSGQRDSAYEAIHLNELSKGVFLLWFLGNCFSTLLLCTELFHKRRCNSKKILIIDFHTVWKFNHAQ